MAEETPRGVATPSGRLGRRARVAGLGVELAGRAPLGSDVPFDFAGAGLVDRLREEGAALQAAGFNHTPPVDLAYIQRKVAGVYLIAARLRAKLSLRPLVAEWL